MARITQVISPYPEPLPNRNSDSPEAFSLHVDQFLSHINTHVDEENTWGQQANDLADEVNSLRDETESLKNQTEQTAKTIKTGTNFYGTSNTTLTIGTGIISLDVVEPDRSFGPGSYVRLTATGTDNWMEGVVQEYSNDVLTVNVLSVNGSGTYSTWWIAFSPGTAAQLPPEFYLMQAMSFY